MHNNRDSATQKNKQFSQINSFQKEDTFYQPVLKEGTFLIIVHFLINQGIFIKSKEDL